MGYNRVLRKCMSDFTNRQHVGYLLTIKGQVSCELLTLLASILLMFDYSILRRHFVVGNTVQ